MKTTSVVSLGLRDFPVQQAIEAEPESTVLRRIVGNAVETVADTLGTGESIPVTFAAAVGECQTALGANLEANLLEPVSKRCFESARTFGAERREREAEHRSQIAALVASVRNAVEALGGTHRSVGEALNGSADRVERLARTDDINDIRAQLCEEVERLRCLAVEQHRAWERDVQEFDRRISTLQTELESSRREAELDPLTSVANRRTFERTVRGWLGQPGARFVLAIVDIDDFKSVNDRHGHTIGDQVLVAVAKQLAGAVRSTDLVGRLGGDEFAVLAASLTLAQAERRLTSVIADVATAARSILHDRRGVSISVGVTEYSAGDTLDSLQTRADTALYRAKRAGKHRVFANAGPFIRDLMAGRPVGTDGAPAERRAVHERVDAPDRGLTDHPQ